MSNEPSPAAGSPPGKAPSGRSRPRTRSDGRARPSAPAPGSRLERHRGLILGLVAVVAVVLVGGVVFVQASSKAYACSTLSQPAAVTTPAGGSPAPLGQVQPDMGRAHILDGQTQRYAYCPPASGNHYSSANGPIPARYYGPDDSTLPQGWIHNLEHGGIVILYSCARGGCDPATEQALQALYQSFPDSPLCKLPKGTTSPVIARFDEMSTPYAALVWGRVLLQDQLDTGQILEFYRTEAELKNPEQQCQRPAPGTSAAPAGSPSTSPAAAPSAAPAASPGSSPGPS